MTNARFHPSPSTVSPMGGTGSPPPLPGSVTGGSSPPTAVIVGNSSSSSSVGSVSNAGGVQGTAALKRTAAKNRSEASSHEIRTKLFFKLGIDATPPPSHTNIAGISSFSYPPTSGGGSMSSPTSSLGSLLSYQSGTGGGYHHGLPPPIHVSSRPPLSAGVRFEEPLKYSRCSFDDMYLGGGVRSSSEEEVVVEGDGSRGDNGGDGEEEEGGGPLNGGSYHSSSSVMGSSASSPPSSSSGGGQHRCPEDNKLQLLTTSTGKKNRSKKKRSTHITFHDSVSVVPIPMRTEYSDRVRQRMWSDRNEIHRNATRNSIEFSSEGWNWRTVLEDESMYVCAETGELVHPVHCHRYYVEDPNDTIQQQQHQVGVMGDAVVAQEEEDTTSSIMDPHQLQRGCLVEEEGDGFGNKPMLSRGSPCHGTE